MRAGPPGTDGSLIEPGICRTYFSGGGAGAVDPLPEAEQAELDSLHELGTRLFAEDELGAY